MLIKNEILKFYISKYKNNMLTLMLNNRLWKRIFLLTNVKTLKSLKRTNKQFKNILFELKKEKQKFINNNLLQQYFDKAKFYKLEILFNIKDLCRALNNLNNEKYIKHLCKLTQIDTSRFKFYAYRILTQQNNTKLLKYVKHPEKEQDIEFMKNYFEIVK
jgi:hypothetical protein